MSQPDGRPPDEDSSIDEEAQSPNHENSRWHKGDLKGLKKFSRKSRQNTFNSLQRWYGWEDQGIRTPYHEYVHRLVECGWINLIDLDEFMKTDLEDRDLVISVLDVADSEQKGLHCHHHEDLHDEMSLRNFMADNPKHPGVKVRFYLAEQKGFLASSIVETLGSTLRLDPRFFQWNIGGSKHMLSPAIRHRAPFTAINFRVLEDTDGDGKVTIDTSPFRVSIYVLLDEEGDGWTGIVLFNSHAKLDLYGQAFITPPSFSGTDFSHFPPPPETGPKTFRELYLAALDFYNPLDIIASPFYAFSPLFRLNCFCWNVVLYATREEDARIGGISEVHPINHAEELRHTLDVVRRYGSLGWKRSGSDKERDQEESLEEDFQHAIKQAEGLWTARNNMAEVRKRRSDAKISALTNAFTFFFVPISLISSIYGMNVSQISGSSSNPNIWQFFVATALLNVIILGVLALSSWLQVLTRHGRYASIWEILAFAFGFHHDALGATKQQRRAGKGKDGLLKVDTVHGGKV